MRPTYFIGLLCMSLALAAPAFACFQGSSAAEIRRETINQAKEARLLEQIMESPVPATRPGDAAKPPEEAWKKAEAEALTSVFKGDYLNAISLLQKAEAAAPGHYSVAASLGTTYELAGQNSNALRWITEALRRNPDAHDKTEWVHLLVLQAKVRSEQQPSAAFAALITLPEEFTEHTLISIPGAKHPVSEVKRAIHYQLRERMKFVKPTDIYVADLLYTLSLIDARLHGYESAYTYAK